MRSTDVRAGSDEFMLGPVMAIRGISAMSRICDTPSGVDTGKGKPTHFALRLSINSRDEVSLVMRKAEREDVSKTLRGRELPPLPHDVSLTDPKPGSLEPVALAAFSQQVVWYRLMKLTNLINRPFFSRFAKAYHLTINDARVLVSLASMPEAAAHELCDATGMHPMNVSRSVATLRRQARITERRDPANGRRKILRLTPKGWAVCQTFVPDMNKMSDFLISSMTPPEVEFLSKVVNQLIHRLETVDPDCRVLLEKPDAAESVDHRQPA